MYESKYVAVTFVQILVSVLLALPTICLLFYDPLRPIYVHIFLFISLNGSLYVLPFLTKFAIWMPPEYKYKSVEKNYCDEWKDSVKVSFESLTFNKLSCKQNQKRSKKNFTIYRFVLFNRSPGYVIQKAKREIAKKKKK